MYYTIFIWICKIFDIIKEKEKLFFLKLSILMIELGITVNLNISINFHNLIKEMITIVLILNISSYYGWVDTT